MSKKAIITISLVPESENVSNEVIKDQIRKESFIPFYAEIEKIEIEESKSTMVKRLRKRGLSKNVATNVVKFYRSDSDMENLKFQ